MRAALVFLEERAGRHQFAFVSRTFLETQEMRWHVEESKKAAGVQNLYFIRTLRSPKITRHDVHAFCGIQFDRRHALNPKNGTCLFHAAPQRRD